MNIKTRENDPNHSLRNSKRNIDWSEGRSDGNI